MMRYLRSYLDLTKTGIILFALLSALAGYAIGYNHSVEFEWMHPILLVAGLYLVCAGSFALNQAQEWKSDAQMKRTERRPIPQGVISAGQAYVLASVFLLVGHFFLYLLEPVTSLLALVTVLLYNGLYTLYWKKHLAYGAVPGAVPGAMPVVIGYSANDIHIFSSACIYLFLIMFLWQMPHFWSLAIRYKEDYAKGGFPVLPVLRGSDVTLYQIGLYTFIYVALALASPLFLKGNLTYLCLVIPVSLKVLWEFFKYFRSKDPSSWLPFFLWVNLSMLAYLAAPVVDKWLLL
jgi:protoheme IX farnesyltransferase